MKLAQTSIINTIPEQDSMNEINIQYDRQIRKLKKLLNITDDDSDCDESENKYYKLILQIKASVIDKEIFNLTHAFSIQDWNRMRDEEYYITKDSIKSEYQKKIFLLRTIKSYLKIS